MPRLTLTPLAAVIVLGAGPVTGAEPAATITRLIDAAPAGGTVHVPAGVYNGHLRIAKPVRLIGDRLPVIDGGGDGDVVEIAAPGVELSGFVIQGTGINLDQENVAVRVLAANATIEGNTIRDALFGIDLRQAPGCVVRDNSIGGKDLDIARRGDGLRLWRSDRCLIENNTIHDGRDAILWYSNGVTVRGNHINRCRYGFHLMFSNNVRLEGNELVENSVGVYFMYSHGLDLVRNRLIRNRGPSGYGIGLKDTDDFRVEENLFVGNRVGVYIDDSPFTNGSPGRFIRNTLAYNDVGVEFLPAVHGATLSENNFIDNFEQVAILGRGELTGNAFAENGRGNFWSDYAGYDLDGDGVGEWQYEPQRLFENLTDREPSLRLFLFSPAQQAVEFVTRALPAIEPEPKFSDPAPLLRPVMVGVAGRAEVESGGLWWVGAGLASIGVVIAAGAFGVPTHRSRAPARARELPIGGGV